MKKKTKGLQKFAIIFCVFVIMSTVTAFAATTTLLTYEGTGIRDKNTISQAKLSKKTTITVKHTTSDVVNIGKLDPNKYSLKVTLLKKGSISWNDTGDSFYVQGKTTKTVSWTKSAGTYKLNFYSKKPTSSGAVWPAFDISGKITK